MSPATDLNDGLGHSETEIESARVVGRGAAALLLVGAGIFAGVLEVKASTVAETSAQGAARDRRRIGTKTADPTTLNVPPCEPAETRAIPPSREAAHAKPVHSVEAPGVRLRGPRLRRPPRRTSTSRH